MIARLLATALIVAGTLAPAMGHSYRKGGLMIGHLSATPAGKGEAGNLVMPILNQGTNQDALVDVKTPVAESVELWLAENGSKRVDKAPLEPTIVLNMLPGGRFMKLVGLRQPLLAGEKFPVTLTFENAGPVVVEAWVENKQSGR